MRTLCLGDVHGRAPALEDILQKSVFDKIKDNLVVLGDIVDGYPWTRQCFEILNTINKKTVIFGNHDLWYMNWVETGKEPPIWINQGGTATLYSYGYDRKNVPKSHLKMIKSAPFYYIDKKNNLYCHGGFDPGIPIETQPKDAIMWDRSLFQLACERYKENNPLILNDYKRVFIGHTSTGFYNREFKPLIFGNIVMLDTGGGDIGKLTIMDVDTLEYWQSDKKSF